MRKARGPQRGGVKDGRTCSAGDPWISHGRRFSVIAATLPNPSLKTAQQGQSQGQTANWSPVRSDDRTTPARGRP